MRLPRIFGEMLGTVDPNNLNLVQILEDEHAEVKQLFSDFENTELESDKLAIAKTVIRKLKIHSLLEQEIVYPSLKDENEDSVELQEAYEEHNLVDTLLLALDSNNGIDNQLKARMCVLSELVKHHIKEEEDKLLPELEKQANLEELTQRFMDRKVELQDKPLQTSQDKISGTAATKAKTRNKSTGKTGVKSQTKATSSTRSGTTTTKTGTRTTGSSKAGKRKQAAGSNKTYTKADKKTANKAAAASESRNTGRAKKTRKGVKLPKNGHARWQPQP